MFQVPQRGPGCQHYLTCAVCLMAPKFMGCGWCSGGCSWEDECSVRWRNESCPPVITGVSPVRPALLHRETLSIFIMPYAARNAVLAPRHFYITY